MYINLPLCRTLMKITNSSTYIKLVKTEFKIFQDSRCLCKCPEPPSGTNSSKKLTNVNFEEFAGEAGNGEKGTKRRSIYVNSLVRF